MFRVQRKEVKQITENTIIQFSVRGFFGLFGSVLGLFLTFYMITVVPKFNSVERQFERFVDDQKEQNKQIYEEFSNINTSLNTLNTTITIMNSGRVGQGSFTAPTEGSLETKKISEIETPIKQPTQFANFNQNPFSILFHQNQVQPPLSQ